MIEISRDQPVRDLVEFNFIAAPVADEPNCFDIRAELRIAQAEIEDSESANLIIVQLTRVFLHLEYYGASIKAGSKMGEPVKPNAFSVKKKVSREVELEGKAGGSIGGKAQTHLSGTASIDVGGSAKSRSLKTEDAEDEIVHLRLKAIGNDRWEVREHDGSPLDVKVLNDERLCVFEIQRGSNAVLVSGAVIARQRDFQFKLPEASIFKKMSHNDRKLFGIFLAKKLARQEYSGEVRLAHLEIDVGPNPS